MARAVSPRDFRDTVGQFATGVTVVTTAHDGVMHGMTANAFASVSLDPLLVLVCVDRAAGMHRLLPHADGFAVTILSSVQERASAYFATKDRPWGRQQFEGFDWQPAPVTGSPVLADGLAFLDCLVHEVHGAGDHSIVLGQVVDLGRLRPDLPPLLFHAGRYHSLQPVEDAGGRPGNER